MTMVEPRVVRDKDAPIELIKQVVSNGVERRSRFDHLVGNAGQALNMARNAGIGPNKRGPLAYLSGFVDLDHRDFGDRGTLRRAARGLYIHESKAAGRKKWSWHLLDILPAFLPHFAFASTTPGMSFVGRGNLPLS